MKAPHSIFFCFHFLSSSSSIFVHVDWYFPRQERKSESEQLLRRRACVWLLNRQKSMWGFFVVVVFLLADIIASLKVREMAIFLFLNLGWEAKSKIELIFFVVLGSLKFESKLHKNRVLTKFNSFLHHFHFSFSSRTNSSNQSCKIQRVNTFTQGGDCSEITDQFFFSI